MSLREVKHTIKNPFFYPATYIGYTDFTYIGSTDIIVYYALIRKTRDGPDILSVVFIFFFFPGARPAGQFDPSTEIFDGIG
jgi:hypothetical protein